jgi:hypothetical protein
LKFPTVACSFCINCVDYSFAKTDPKDKQSAECRQTNVLKIIPTEPTKTTPLESGILDIQSVAIIDGMPL